MSSPKSEGLGVTLEHRREPGVDRLRERHRLVAREAVSRRRLAATVAGERGASGAITSSAVLICGSAAASSACSRTRSRRRLVLGCELLSGSPSRGDEPPRRPEERVAVVVLANRARRPVGDLGVRSRMAQVADGAEMEHGGLTLVANPAGELARDLEHATRGRCRPPARSGSSGRDRSAASTHPPGRAR